MSKIFTYMISVLLVILLMGVASAEEELSYLKPDIEQNKCMPLLQYCVNCTYVNITSISYPNGTVINLNYRTQKISSDTFVNNSFCDTRQLGDYVYSTIGDLDGVNTRQAVLRKVTSTGEAFDMTQALMILGEFGLIALFLVIGLTFNKEKWKLKTFFFMAALFMGIILLNSIRVVLGTSSKLSLMGNVGLIVGIVVLSFMFLYFLIYMTIEVLSYFKKRREMKWKATTADAY